MLNQFSWQQFLIATLVISFLWYVVIILLYYKKQFINFFFGNKENKPSQKLKNDWEEEFEEVPDEDESLIGGQALPEGVSEISTEMFGFAPRETSSLVNDEQESNIQLGLIPDLLEELKGLFKILAEADGSKEDFFSLFKMIRSKYPTVSQLQNHNALNDFILENVPFEMSESDLENLWS